LKTEALSAPGRKRVDYEPRGDQKKGNKGKICYAPFHQKHPATKSRPTTRMTVIKDLVQPGDLLPSKQVAKGGKKTRYDSCDDEGKGGGVASFVIFRGRGN